MILGDVFLEGLDVIHDRESKKVGFKLATSCSGKMSYSSLNSQGPVPSRDLYLVGTTYYIIDVWCIIRTASGSFDTSI